MMSFYKFLNKSGLVCPFHKIIWHATILEKVEVFLSLALKNMLHTKKIIDKKCWVVCNGWYLCSGNVETIPHLFFLCHLWKVFELPKIPTSRWGDGQLISTIYELLEGGAQLRNLCINLRINWSQLFVGMCGKKGIGRFSLTREALSSLFNKRPWTPSNHRRC